MAGCFASLLHPSKTRSVKKSSCIGLVGAAAVELVFLCFPHIKCVRFDHRSVLVCQCVPSFVWCRRDHEMWGGSRSENTTTTLQR